MPDRLILKVTEVSEPKEFGNKGSKKLVFKAKNPEGKELSYLTYRTTLFESIKVGAEIDAEVEIKTREYEGNTYTDRQVSQIFVDGQPLGGQKKQWQGRTDNPEQRQSIEMQTAAKIGGELLVAKIITSKDQLGKLTIDWCISRLSDNTSESPKQTLPTIQPVQSVSSPVKAETSSKPPEHTTEEKVGFFDMEGLKENLKLAKWKQVDVVAFLRSNAVFHGLNVGGKFEEIIERLNKEQSEYLDKEIKSRIEMA